MNKQDLITATLLMSLFCGVASAAWANTSYMNAKNITLLGADTELTNYPYLVSIAKESAMQSDYDDLIFYDQPVWNDGNLIDFEIESYNATVATVWLNITTLPTAGKTVSVYYGNASVGSTEDSNATWNGDYVGVWHMSDAVDYAWNDYKDSDGVITTNISMLYTITESNVLYEDGMFKMWVHLGHGAESALGYFTSIDGYDWTCVDDDLIDEPCWCPSIYKNESTGDYWIYNGNTSVDKVDLYIGTNETNLEIDTWGCWSDIDAGGTGIGNSHIWKENISDWYMIFEYTGPGWISKYATSNNGKDWTFHNQIIVSGFGSNGLCGPCVWKNNGTYYMVYHGNKAVVSGIPTDIYVATSTNRQDWTYQGGFEITREFDWEGVGNIEGQVGDPTIVECNGEVYIFYTGRHDQAHSSEYPEKVGLIHLNESLVELCDRIDTGNQPMTRDSTLNDRNGAITNVQSSTNGAVGSCAVFGGSSSYIDLGTPLNIPTGTHEFWFNTSNIDTDLNQPYAMDNDGATPFICVRAMETTGVDTFKVMVGTSAWFDDYNILPNEFYSVSIVVNNGGTDYLYVNGNEVDTEPHDSSGAGAVGWYFGCGRVINNWYIGTIDEGRVSDVVRSANWINLSYQMVANSSYVTFGADTDFINDIVLGANQHGLLRKNVTSAETFSTIAAGIAHDKCYTWWDSTNDKWKSYRVGYSYNSGLSIPQNDSYFVLMDGTGTTIACSGAVAGTVAIPIGWYTTYLRESSSKTLTVIKTDMGGNVVDLYAFNSSAGAWTDTGAYSVLPNQGLLINSSAGFDWDGTVP